MTVSVTITALPGCTQYAAEFDDICELCDMCRYLDKLYVLSSAAAVQEFIRNPRPFLLPPQPQPPCKIVVCGPAKSGKTELCYRLADKYGAEVGGN
jgi:hypothetical protein